MPRQSLLATRSERNQALIDAMILAASADGSLAGVEMRTLVARVLERPEFEGTSAEQLNQAIESAAKRLSSAKNLTEVMQSLQQRLPDHENRLLAFGLAGFVTVVTLRELLLPAQQRMSESKESLFTALMVSASRARRRAR